jgi:hypothetical protein
MWNIGPAHRSRQTVLHDLPTPMDKRVSGPSPQSAVYQAWRKALSKRRTAGCTASVR